MGALMRKEGVITTPFTKKNSMIVYILLFLTFLVTDIFTARSQFVSTMATVSQMADVVIPLTTGTFIAFIVFNSIISLLLLELYLMVYYFFAFQSMRGFMPFSNKEFKENARPFFIIRNLIWAGLSGLMWIPGGYFIGVGYLLFEIIATMIVLFPMFFFMKKHFVKDGYAGKIFMNFVIPFLVYNGINIFSSFM